MTKDSRPCPRDRQPSGQVVRYLRLSRSSSSRATCLAVTAPRSKGVVRPHCFEYRSVHKGRRVEDVEVTGAVIGLNEHPCSPYLDCRCAGFARAAPGASRSVSCPSSSRVGSSPRVSAGHPGEAPASRACGRRAAAPSPHVSTLRAWRDDGRAGPAIPRPESSLLGATALQTPPHPTASSAPDIADLVRFGCDSEHVSFGGVRETADRARRESP